MKKSSVDITVSDQQLERELKRTVMKRKRRATCLRTVSSLIVFAAILLLISVVWFPLYPVLDSSMEPVLKEGQLVIAMRTQKLKPDDIAVFFHENQILIKRVIGIAGDRIEDPLPEAADQVPDGHYFTKGDNDGTPEPGCVAEEKIVGKIIFCIWPLQYAGYIG